MQINQCNLDFKRLTEQAVAGFEKVLKECDAEADRNLLTAIDILRNYEPSIQRAGPDLNAFSDLEREIITAWNQLVDEHIRTHAQPRVLKDAILQVDVDSGVWLTEICHYHKKEILNRIQQRFGRQVIRKIHYHQNDLPSNEVRVSFLIPDLLIRLSATPQLPCSIRPEHPLSAQDLIRSALDSACPTNRVLVSFHREGSSPAPIILKECPQSSAREILARLKFPECEPFAEDEFTCQRCGRQAPEALLFLGEVKQFAVSDRDYVTICIDCDQAIRVQGDSIRDTIFREEEIELRKQQLDFMAKFQHLSDSWPALVPHYSLGAREKHLLCELISKYEVAEIKNGMQIAVNAYVESVDGMPTNTSASFAFRRVGGICHNKRFREESGSCANQM